MERKVGFGFKVNKSLKSVDSLFAGEDEEKSKEQNPKDLYFDEEDDELRNQMGFSGFGKLKATKQKPNPITSDDKQVINKPKARQFDLEKEMTISKEIASERKNQLKNDSDQSESSDQGDQAQSPEKSNEIIAEPDQSEQAIVDSVEIDEELNEDEFEDDSR